MSGQGVLAQDQRGADYMKNPVSTNRWTRSVLAATATAALVFAFAPAANAAPSTQVVATEEVPVDHPVSGVLDPATFEGPVLIATTAGEIPITVKKGELLGKAKNVRAAVARGDSVQNLSNATALASCGSWHNAVALPTSYATSANGCAVAGYSGYTRPYSWSNQSDVTACVRGKGYKGSTVIWQGLGACNSANDVRVPWGNVLAYTQTSGRSLSGVTGAAYRWFT